MFSVIKNIYKKKTKRPNLMEFFTVTEKMKKFFFWQLEIFDVAPVVHTSKISSYKKKFIFSVAVKNSIKLGPFVFLL